MTEETVTVVDREGHKANATLRHSGHGSVFVTLNDGRQREVATKELERQGKTVALPLRFSDFPVENETTIPVSEERVKVATKKVEKVLRLRKKVHTREEVVDEPVIQQEFEVTRVPVDREVEEFVPVREEADTIIIPVFEERLVTRKVLVLTEEIHVARRKTERHASAKVALRSEDIEVEQDDASHKEMDES